MSGIAKYTITKICRHIWLENTQEKYNKFNLVEMRVK
jgi:hypothetical protein